MSNFAFPPPALSTVPVEGDDVVFPVRRILCVGRNYAAHRREMGGDDRDPPFFFAKPADAVVPPGQDVAYPPVTKNLHHEIELVVALGAGGANVAPRRAWTCVYGYAVGVDLTRRDLQNAAKDKGQPWDSSKGFDASAPISAIRRWDGRPAAGPHPHLGQRPDPPGRHRRRHDLERPPRSSPRPPSCGRLAPGDLIFTGTPEGVGPVAAATRSRARWRAWGSCPSRWSDDDDPLFSAWRATAPYRVRIGLKLKGLAYDYVALDLIAGEQREAAYKAVNPQG
jgi:fumarylpyruvate hydrolase